MVFLLLFFILRLPHQRPRLTSYLQIRGGFVSFSNQSFCFCHPHCVFLSYKYKSLLIFQMLAFLGFLTFCLLFTGFPRKKPVNKRVEFFFLLITSLFTFYNQRDPGSSKWIAGHSCETPVLLVWGGKLRKLCRPLEWQFTMIRKFCCCVC